MSDGIVLRGSKPVQLPRPSRTYAPDRVCAADGCDTRLSVYNRASHCWLHTPTKFPVARGERRRKAA